MAKIQLSPALSPQDRSQEAQGGYVETLLRNLLALLAKAQ